MAIGLVMRKDDTNNMNVLEKILEKQELEAIKDLMEENEKCLNQCEGACGSAKNGVCNCSDGILVQAIRKMQDYLSVVTDTNVGKWIPVNERLPEKTGYYLVQLSRKLPNEDYSDRVVILFNGEEKEFMCYAELIIAWRSLPEAYKGE